MTLTKALAVVMLRRPSASAEQKAAFANAAMYAAYGLGAERVDAISARELIACEQLGAGRHSWEAAIEILLRDDGPIFEPISKKHKQKRQFLLVVHGKSNDSPEDIRAMEALDD